MCVLVTDAVNSFVRVRALVSALDVGRLWDLRCLVREHLVDWLRRRQPSALPQVRITTLPPAEERSAQVGRGEHDADARVFSESVEGEERVRAFDGTGA